MHETNLKLSCLWGDLFRPRPAFYMSFTSSLRTSCRSRVSTYRSASRLSPIFLSSYFFRSLVLGPLNSLVWYVPSLRYTRGLGWRMHCGVLLNRVPINNISLVPPMAGLARRPHVHRLRPKLDSRGHGVPLAL